MAILVRQVVSKSLGLMVTNSDLLFIIGFKLVCENISTFYKTVFHMSIFACNIV